MSRASRKRKSSSGSPFVQMLLNLVEEVCAPTAADWPQVLAEKLTARLNRQYSDGHRLTPDDLNAHLWRIAALEERIDQMEKRLTPPPPPGQDEVMVSNVQEIVGKAAPAVSRRVARLDFYEENSL